MISLPNFVTGIFKGTQRIPVHKIMTEIHLYWKSKIGGDTCHSVFPPSLLALSKVAKIQTEDVPTEQAHTALKTMNILYRTEVWT